MRCLFRIIYLIHYMSATVLLVYLPVGRLAAWSRLHHLGLQLGTSLLVLQDLQRGGFFRFIGRPVSWSCVCTVHEDGDIFEKLLRGFWMNSMEKSRRNTYSYTNYYEYEIFFRRLCRFFSLF